MVLVLAMNKSIMQAPLGVAIGLILLTHHLHPNLIGIKLVVASTDTCTFSEFRNATGLCESCGGSGDHAADAERHPTQEDKCVCKAGFYSGNKDGCNNNVGRAGVCDNCRDSCAVNADFVNADGITADDRKCRCDVGFFKPANNGHCNSGGTGHANECGGCIACSVYFGEGCEVCTDEPQTCTSCKTGYT